MTVLAPMKPAFLFAVVLLFMMPTQSTSAQSTSTQSTSTQAPMPDGKAQTVKKTFSRTTSIEQYIDASPARVWALLTDAASMPEWNSTIVSLEGTIASGEKIRLVSSLDSSRTFKLKVKEIVPEQRLVWGDGLGERVYTLSPEGEGVRVNMTERIGNFMFPLFAGKIPPFDEAFEQFMRDLKAAAER